jgi:hypothetical protein
MRGNLHVRFLGEGAAARRPPYPTVNVGSIPITRSSPLPLSAPQSATGSTSSRATIPSSARLGAG